MNILCHRNHSEFLNSSDEGMLPEVIPICVITNMTQMRNHSVLSRPEIAVLSRRWHLWECHFLLALSKLLFSY